MYSRVFDREVQVENVNQNEIEAACRARITTVAFVSISRSQLASLTQTPSSASRTILDILVLHSKQRSIVAQKIAARDAQIKRLTSQLRKYRGIPDDLKRNFKAHQRQNR